MSEQRAETGAAAPAVETAPAEAGAAAAALGELVAVVERLLGETGCPWDRRQTPQSLRSYLLEETYELLDALDRQDTAAVEEELGDLLYQIVFQAALFRRRGAFGLAEVARGVAAKLRRRHPHVFGTTLPGGAGSGPAAAKEAAVRSEGERWAALKRAERSAAAGGGAGGRGGAAAASALDGVPGALPALARAEKLQARAAAVGFDWPSLAGVLAKLDEERRELAAALDSGERERVAAELGDLLFTVVNLARFVGVGAEDALREAAGRFERRFRALEAAARAEGSEPAALDLESLERLWQRAKAAEHGR
ncbi:MAG: hypothetical protein KatS3mg102_2974 [Planctomycetota bacterium]|nr:MAG: hypothetical protein KatS3mg102_2974 [Planctomycetota bacterium]